MRLLRYLLVLLLISPAYGVVTRVQSASTSSNAATVLNKAYTSNLGTGHLLIGVAACFATFCSTNSITSTNNGTWTKALSINHGAEISVYYVCNSVSGADTVTLTSSGSSFDMHLHIYEYSGILTASCLDQQGTAVPNGGTTFTATTAGSVSQATELLFGAIAGNLSGSITGTGTWTTRQETLSTNYDVATSDSSTTTGLSGTQSVTASTGVAPTNWAGAIVTFKASSAAAPSPINPIMISRATTANFWRKVLRTIRS